MTAASRAERRPRLRVLHLARAYPNSVIDTLGMWTAWLIRELAKESDVEVISPIPYCPPLPAVGALRQYTRFRSAVRTETREGIRAHHPRFSHRVLDSDFPVIEGRTYEFAVRRLAEPYSVGRFPST